MIIGRYSLAQSGSWEGEFRLVDCADERGPQEARGPAQKRQKSVFEVEYDYSEIAELFDAPVCEEKDVPGERITQSEPCRLEKAGEYKIQNANVQNPEFPGKQQKPGNEGPASTKKFEGQRTRSFDARAGSENQTKRQQISREKYPRNGAIVAEFRSDEA